MVERADLKTFKSREKESRRFIQVLMGPRQAGGFETIYLPHWSHTEMQAAFGWDADTFTWFGGYPGSAGLIGDELCWKQYVRDSIVGASISKNILQLTRIDKPALLKNLFELGCSYSGQVLSFTKVMG